jgi:hypothetical protein
LRGTIDKVGREAVSLVGVAPAIGAAGIDSVDIGIRNVEGVVVPTGSVRWTEVPAR